MNTFSPSRSSSWATASVAESAPPATGKIEEAYVALTPHGGQLQPSRYHGCVNRFAGHERLHVEPELGAVFSEGRGFVFSVGAVDHLLRHGGIQYPRGSLDYQHVAIFPVVITVRFVQFPLACIGAAQAKQNGVPVSLPWLASAPR